MTYERRIIDDVLDELLPGLPAISIEGAKAVGKTETARQRAATFLYFDDPSAIELVRAAPEQLASYDEPLLLDEWQRMPGVWDRVRRMVDEDTRGGRFILTGSATQRDAPVHSGAGRIVRLRMRPLSVAERGIAIPTVKLADLLEGGVAVEGTTDVALADYIREIVASGFPGIRKNSGRNRRAQLDGYIDRVVEHDFPEMGLRVRRPQLLRNWLSAYAAATATTAKYSVIGRAASPGEADGPSRDSATAYRDVLANLWLLDQVPAWSPSHNNFARLAAAPKHFLADPALTARLLGLDEERLLRAESPTDFEPHDGTILGNLFEALVALSLHTYAEANEASLSHFRTGSGTREVDFIIHKGDDTIVGIEVKLTRVPEDSDVKHLQWLKTQLGSKLTDMVIITTGPFAYRRDDGVAVVPLALLGP